MAHVDNLRRQFPAVRHGVYLNTGTFGLLPTDTVQAMQDSLASQLENGRRADTYLADLNEARAVVRTQLAQWFSVPTETIALTESTTHGLNVVLNGLRFQARDEVIVLDVEHPGSLLPLFLQKQRQGVVIRVVSGSQSREELLRAIERAFSPRTRLLVVSHVSYLTGHNNPIAALTQLAHQHHVQILVDGAQGAGTEPTSLAELQCDFYAFPGHKWLCGPDGTGALYVKNEWLSVLEPTYAGYPMLLQEDSFNFSGTFLSPLCASRYEHATTNLASWRGLSTSLQYLKVTVGADYMYTRLHGLTGYLIDKLLDLNEAKIITPRDARAGLAHFTWGSRDAGEVVTLLRDRDIYVKAVRQNNTIRVSPHFYNQEGDVDRFLRALMEV